MLDSSSSEIAKILLEDLVRALIHAAILDEDLWRQSPEFLYENKKLFLHREVVRKILESRSQRQSNIWAFTLNYDLALEWVARSMNLTLKNGFAGDAIKEFNPAVFQSKREYTENEKVGSENPIMVNLVKIHGSLNWTYEGEKVVELSEDVALKELKDYLRFESRTQIPELMILPGMYSQLKVPKFPHTVFLQQFEKFLNLPESALFIVGYGFCDNHINEAIHSALSKNKDLKLVIYFPEFTGMEDTSNLPKGLTRIIEMESSNVIIVGGGENAYFDAFCEHLPESNEPKNMDANLKFPVK